MIFKMVFQKLALRYFCMCEAFLLSLACFRAFLHMCKPRVVDLIFVTPLSAHIYIYYAWKVFPLSFQMHEITLH